MEGAGCVVSYVYMVGFGAVVGFFECACLAVGRISALEQALWRFACEWNWKVRAVDGCLVHAWVGGGHPRKMADEALR